MGKNYNLVISKIVTAAGGSKSSKDLLRRQLRKDFQKEIFSGKTLKSYSIKKIDKLNKRGRKSLDVKLDWHKR